MIKVIQATESHLIEFGKKARKEDLEEIYMASGKTYQENLETLKGTIDLVNALIHVETGTLLGIGGDLHGHIWLVLTDDVLKHKIEFLRFSKRYLKVLLKKHSKIYNMVYVKNTLHIKWLEWLGVKFSGISSDGLFKGFYMKRRDA